MASLVAKRYSTALFDLAQETGKVDAIDQEVIAVKEVFENEKELMQLLNHPKITLEEKKKMLESLFKDKISNELMGLLVVVVQKKRHNNLMAILDEFSKQVQDFKNIATAYVVSAVALSENQKDALVNKLKATMNKEINLEVTVDESIIGGLIIRVGDEVLDNSIKSKLNKLTVQLKTLQLS